MIKKLAIALSLLLTFAFYLFAADFWDSTPFTEWNEKEIQKILTDSPWGDRVSVRTGQKGVVANDEAKGPIMGELEVPVTLTWQSALPVKQALVKVQFGGEAGTAAGAKAILDRQETFYVLRVSGLPGNVRAAAANKEELTAETVLRVKGKADLKPADIQMPAAPAPKGKAAIPSVQFVTAAYQRGGRGGGGFDGGAPPGGAPGGRGFGTFDLFFLFPRDAAYTVADKEVEFVTKIDKLTIRRKFKFQDMVFNGKLEM
jgi:hypothetical protein